MKPKTASRKNPKVMYGFPRRPPKTDGPKGDGRPFPRPFDKAGVAPGPAYAPRKKGRK